MDTKLRFNEDKIISITCFGEAEGDINLGFRIVTTNTTLEFVIHDRENICCERLVTFTSCPDFTTILGSDLLECNIDLSSKTLPQEVYDDFGFEDQWQGSLVISLLVGTSQTIYFKLSNYHSGYYAHRASVDLRRNNELREVYFTYL